MTLESLLTNSISRSQIVDRLSLRLNDCLLDLKSESGKATKKDLAILVRQWIRRSDINDNRDGGLYRIPTEFSDFLEEELVSCGIEKHILIDGGVALSAKAWAPKWVRGSNERNPVDQCSGEQVRRSVSSTGTDKAFKELTGFNFYKSSGQFAACQVVKSMRDGSTAIVMLPTGSGKTEVALSMIENLVNVHPMVRDKPSIVSVLVVPYVALIKDLDRRLVDLYQGKWKGPTPLTFSYTYETDDRQLELLLSRINFPDESDIPGIIITSPESFVGRFRNEIRNWAMAGRLGALIFDEAHLLYQSGVGFRLDFRDLPVIRKQLNELSPSGCQPRTLLMSATVGQTELSYLIKNFGPPENLSLVDATSLRSEPDFFVSENLSTEIREKSLIESLHRLPRPAIIYVTRPDDAKALLRSIRDWGFGRVRCVVGETPAREREEVLNSLRTGSSPSSCDLVVANSAFGLGIDCDEVRTVIHFCLPESVDRWYQEVGRGGRDGRSSVGLLITEGRKGSEEWIQARQNIPKALLYDTLIKRWDTITKFRIISSADESRVLLDLRTPPSAIKSLDWNESNGHTEYGLKWNRTILYSLQEMGYIEIERPSASEFEQIRGKGSTHFDWAAIVNRHGFDLSNREFSESWVEFRDKLSEPFEIQLESMFQIATGECSPCEGIRKTYEMPVDLVNLFKPCLQVESCKDHCGHCSSCFEYNVVRSHYGNQTPFMSVAMQECPSRQMRIFVRELRNFWLQVAEWRALAELDVNVLPISRQGIDAYQSVAFDDILIRNQFWIYSRRGSSVNSDFATSIKPQVPSPALISTDSLSEGVFKCFYRKDSFRRDFGIPLLLLDVVDNEKPNLEVEFGSPVLDWRIPEQFGWVEKSSELIRKLIDGGFDL